MYPPSPIRRHNVKSATVRSVGYDVANWVLQVEFDQGAVYNYFRVPPEEHAKLMGAESIGAYIQREIKPYYEYEEAETAQA